MAQEQTFVLVKPGVLQRRLVGEVLTRIERKGLRIQAMKLMRMTPEMCERQYDEHKGKPFYDGLVEFMSSGPCIAMAVNGEEAISMMRKLAGATDAAEAEPGTIRGDFAGVTKKNLVHASDSRESAARELELFFSAEEIHAWDDKNEDWIV